MNLEFKNNHDFLTLFERRLSEYTGAPYVVLTDCCTNAIFLSLKYLYKDKKEITIPSKTYLSVPNIIELAGHKVKFSNYDWEKGYQLDGTCIYDLAVGFEPNMYKPGQYQCLSFQQKKSLPIGRGGAILLDDYEAYKVLKRMTNDGRDGSIETKKDKNIIKGYHMYMTPDNAAKGVLLLNQLKEVKFGNQDDYPDISVIYK